MDDMAELKDVLEKAQTPPNEQKSKVFLPSEHFCKIIRFSSTDA